MPFRRLIKLDVRWYAVIALGWMALLSGWETLRYAIAVCLVACALDILFICLRKRRFEFPLSALVSGLIISAAAGPGRGFYIAPIAAIFSKHLIKASGRHIFNPAAFGLMTANVLFGLPLVWGVEARRAIIIVSGLWLAYKIKRLALVFSFLAGLLIVSVLYSLFQHRGLSVNTAVINLFFVFFMLIEPKTSPVYFKSKLIYGGIVALLVFLGHIFLSRYDFLISALILGNVAGVFLRKVR